MTQVSLDEAKDQVSVAQDFTDHDALISGHILAAEAWIQRHVRRDLDAEFPGGWPAHIVQAVKLMVGHYYTNREAVVMGVTLAEMPLSVTALLASEINFEG